MSRQGYAFIPDVTSEYNPRTLHRLDCCSITICAIFWLSFLLFGAFAVCQYVVPYFFGSAQMSWEETDKGLYRPHHFWSNRLLVIHWVGGVFLMIAGPTQLIPTLRQRYPKLHRWTGRIYIVAALCAAVAATGYTLIFRTSRYDIHEDVGNVVFGICMAVCAVQTFRYRRKVEAHRKWATRLFVTVAAAVFVRLLFGIYFGLVLYTPWQGNLTLYEGIYYSFCLPPLLLLELYWKMNDSQKSTAKAALFYFSICWGVVTALLAGSSWIPAIFGTSQIQGGLLDTYNHKNDS